MYVVLKSVKVFVGKKGNDEKILSVTDILNENAKLSGWSNSYNGSLITDKWSIVNVYSFQQLQTWKNTQMLQTCPRKKIPVCI